MNVTDKLGLPSFIFGRILDHGWLNALLLMWLVTPGMYYVIAALFEKRLAPIWRRNVYLSQLFFGACVASMVAAAEEMPQDPDGWYRSVWYDAICIVIVVATIVILRTVAHEGRTPDGLPDFDKTQAGSPTLRYYDFVVTPGLWLLLLKVCLPAYIAGSGIWPRIVAPICIALFVAVGKQDAAYFNKDQWSRIERAHPHYGLRFPWSRFGWVNDNRK